MTKPTRAEIQLAEARLAASRVRTLESIEVLRTSVRDKVQSLRDKLQSVRDTLTRPTTFAMAAALGVLAGKLIMRRRARRGTVTSRNELAAGGVVAAVLSRIGWRFAARRLMRWWSSNPPSKPAQPAWPYAASSPASRAPARNVGNTLH